MWLHKGDEGFGGGNDNLLIHACRGEQYRRDGVLEEVLVHEATHTSMDPEHATCERWLAARRADPSALSEYAADNPDREDLAETMGPYLALRFKPQHLQPGEAEMLQRTIPARIAYLDSLELSMQRR